MPLCSSSSYVQTKDHTHFNGGAFETDAKMENVLGNVHVCDRLRL